MGWWGFGVMDGDTPCDIQISLDEAVMGSGVDMETVPLHVYHDSFKTFLNGWKGFVAQFAEWGEDDRDIAVQVVGYNCLLYAVDVPDDLREEINAICDRQLQELDSWREPESRAAALNGFKNAIAQNESKGVVVGGLGWSGALNDRADIERQIVESRKATH